MSVFKKYAEAYDTMYANKEYDAECDAVEALLNRHSEDDIATILDLGCGTGGHLLPLTSRGFQVTGVDQSAEMLAQAQEKADHMGMAVTLHQGDLRTLALGETFDAAISMFAVVSYLTTNADLSAAFRAIADHLKPGGLFLFDFWYGPGVLRDPPAERSRLIEQGDGGRLLRIASPTHDPLTQTVVVNYRLIHLEDDAISSEVEEAHPMRYFFPQELRLLLSDAGFELLSLTRLNVAGTPLDESDWTACIVAQREGGTRKHVEKPKSLK